MQTHLSFTGGGSAGIQTDPIGAPRAAQVLPVPNPSATQRLVTYSWAGKEFFGGASERKARDIVKAMGVVPVILGPRCVRLVLSELEAAVGNLPRRTQPSEPSQLLRARIERQKQTGVPA